MSKFLATAAEIVGGIALVATGLGAVPGLGLGASALHVIGVVAKVSSFAAAALAAGSALTAKRISSASPDEWSANPNAGMDIVFGHVMPGAVRFTGAAP
ncbi:MULTISPECIES: hypothetical protein [unclassified Sphingomonas]|uniref:hypothetical protein n=1 Tax=unclassified Sphingomonas TaxID=196159 RepID=UPI00226A37D0|nr:MULTISPECIES: hypothetical protein [unclassified Sphingomonas]